MRKREPLAGVCGWLSLAWLERMGGLMHEFESNLSLEAASVFQWYDSPKIICPPWLTSHCLTVCKPGFTFVHQEKSFLQY